MVEGVAFFVVQRGVPTAAGHVRSQIRTQSRGPLQPRGNGLIRSPKEVAATGGTQGDECPGNQGNSAWVKGVFHTFALFDFRANSSAVRAGDS